MSEMLLSQFIEFNPAVKLPKGTVAPFVPMNSVRPWRRDVTAAEAKQYTSGTKFLDGDALLARITPSLENGKTSIYRATEAARHLPAFGSTEFIVARGIEGVSDTEYIYYLLRTEQVRSIAIASMTGSSGRQRVQLDTLKSAPWELPSIFHQQQIAATLGALDDKIESNTRLVRIIPEIISACVAKGLENKFEQKPVSNLAKFINGGAYTKGASGHGRVVIRISELNSGIGSSTVYSNIKVPDSKTARAGDILMSWSGTLGVYVWTREDAIINQHIFKVLPEDYPSWLVFDRLQSVIAEFREIAAGKATTMGHIRREHLTSTLIDIPDEASIKTLDKTCGPLWNKYISAQLETNYLANLRDTLLPELMTGRIRVPEAREVIEEEVGDVEI